MHEADERRQRRGGCFFPFAARRAGSQSEEGPLLAGRVDTQIRSPATHASRLPRRQKLATWPADDLLRCGFSRVPGVFFMPAWELAGGGIPRQEEGCVLLCCASCRVVFSQLPPVGGAALPCRCPTGPPPPLSSPRAIREMAAKGVLMPYEFRAFFQESDQSRGESGRHAGSFIFHGAIRRPEGDADLGVPEDVSIAQQRSRKSGGEVPRLACDDGGTHFGVDASTGCAPGSTVPLLWQSV